MKCARKPERIRRSMLYYGNKFAYPEDFEEFFAPAVRAGSYSALKEAFASVYWRLWDNWEVQEETVLSLGIAYLRARDAIAYEEELAGMARCLPVIRRHMTAEEVQPWNM